MEQYFVSHIHGSSKRDTVGQLSNLQEGQADSPDHRCAHTLEDASDCHEPISGGLHKYDLRADEGDETNKEGNLAVTIDLGVVSCQRCRQYQRSRLAKTIEERAVRRREGTYESHQKPRYFGTDPIIPKSFELVWNHGNDQRVYELIGKDSCFQFKHSDHEFRGHGDPLARKHTKHYNYSEIESPVPTKFTEEPITECDEPNRGSPA